MPFGQRNADQPREKNGEFASTGGAKPTSGKGSGKKRGPYKNVAMTLRKKMQHDAGKEARIAAYKAKQQGAHAVGIHVATAGGKMGAGAAALLGTLLGAGGKILGGMTMKGRGR
jgi:hypothetical protein